jgi:Cohesin domain
MARYTEDMIAPRVKSALIYSFALLTLCIPSFASAAAFNLTVDKESFAIGDTFTVDVKIESVDAGINGAQATISFPKDIVRVVSLDKSTSAFNFWLEDPAYSNETGQITFIGGSISGISGKALQVLRATFKVVGTGATNIIFSDGAVTASDGSGTNVLSAMNGLKFSSVSAQQNTLIQPKQIVRPAVAAAKLPVMPHLNVPLYPDPAAWYADVAKFIVEWDLPRDVTAVATALNQQPAFDPDQSEGLFDNKTFNPLLDGVWYLHVRFKNSVGWGATAHYRIAIDTSPPLSFSLNSPDGLMTANVAPTITFDSKDQPSGIEMYRVFVNGVLATTTSLSSYALLPQRPGNIGVVVQALDQAGNMTESRATLTILEAPLVIIGNVRVTQFTFFTIIIIAILACGMLGWYLGLRAKQKRQRRIFIAERDIHSSFDILKKDVDDLLRKYDGDSLTKQGAWEMKSVLKRISDTIEKNTQYVADNVGDIEK